MKFKPTAKIPDPNGPPSGRFNWVLNVVFAGSQGEMAKALKCSQSIISRIVRGKQEPGAKLLMTLAEYPALSRAWVLTGEGEPLAAQVANYDGDAALPIAREPFAGLPYDHPLSLDDALYPIPRKLHRRSRYCVRMTVEHPFVTDRKLKIGSEDVVLFEPDKNEWPDKLHNRPCLVQVDQDEKLYYARGCEPSRKDGTSHDFDFYNQLSDAIEDVNDLTNEEGRNFKRITVPGDSQAQSTPRACPIQIVAVAMFRLGPI